MVRRAYATGDCSLLFFILVFLLLFYDDSAIEMLRNGRRINTCSGDCSILFFILVFLELFYR